MNNWSFIVFDLVITRYTLKLRNFVRCKLSLMLSSKIERVSILIGFFFLLALQPIVDLYFAAL